MTSAYRFRDHGIGHLPLEAQLRRPLPKPSIVPRSAAMGLCDFDFDFDAAE